jgi:hypothetical protein
MFIVGLTKLSDAQLIKGYFSSSERSLMLCWGSKSMQDRSQYWLYKLWLLVISNFLLGA